jgi:hypothetical protein
MDIGEIALLDYFFAPMIASFATLKTRNLVTILAGILIFCFVDGLIPVRAFLFFYEVCKSRHHEFAGAFWQFCTRWHWAYPGNAGDLLFVWLTVVVANSPLIASAPIGPAATAS